MAKAPYDQITEWQIADTNWRRYVRARDSGHLDYVDIAKKCDEYYRGNQWDEYDKQKLESEGRPALTINAILSTVNSVLGEQTSSRAMVDFKPKREGSQEMATILKKLYSVIHDQNDLDSKESQVFADGLIQDRGYFEVKIDFNENVEGEIKVTVEDPLDIYLDPDAKDYDPSTWNEVIKSRWLSLNEVEILYGEEKVKKLTGLVHADSYYGSDSIYVTEQRFGDAADSVLTGDEGEYSELDRKQIRRVRIVERQYRIPHKCEYFINPKYGDVALVPTEWSESQKATHEMRYGLMRTEKESMKIRYTVSSDKVVLFDDWSIYPFFTIVPFFPYFRRGRPFGMVRNLISPQEQLNKVSSQELHVVNTTANSGWIIETASLANMGAAELEQRGAETGLILEFHKGAAPPMKIPANQIPTGLDRISTKAAINIKEISGISDAMLGYDSPEVSGIAIEAKQARGKTQIQVPLDNLNRTRGLLAKRILTLLQTWYDNPRIFFMTQGGTETPEVVEINQALPDGSKLYDITVGEYDISVSSQPSRDVYEDAQFAEAMALRAADVVIPDDTIIEYSHLEDKMKIAERVREMTGTAPPTPEQQQQNQALQQLQLQQIQLNIETLATGIDKMKSEMAVNMAKAYTEVRSDEVQEHKLREKMIDVAMSEADNKTKLIQTMVNAGQRADEKELESKTRVETALIRNTDNLQRVKLDAAKTTVDAKLDVMKEANKSEIEANKVAAQILTEGMKQSSRNQTKGD
jgi:hypothetical protein